MNNNIEVLHSKITELEAENALLKSDVAILGQENLRLSNALTLARVEIARLSAPKNGKGRPRKDITGTYEDYLVRETMQIVTESIRSVSGKKSERIAAFEADKRIRGTAKNAQESGMPGPFKGLAFNYPSDENSIYTAFRRGKRLLGWGSKRQSKN